MTLQRKPAVEYYLEGRDAWRRGFGNVFLRIRGILISIVLSIIFLTGSPWWLSNLFPKYYIINSSYYITGALSYFFILFMLGIIYLRRRTLRSLYIKYYLHQLAHQIRDKEAELYIQVHPNRKYSKSKIESHLRIYLSDISELLKRYFQLLLKEENIDVAIRLASTDDRQIVYKTYARSKGLNPRRAKYSEPIAIDEGAPKFFRQEKRSQGVLFINDIEQASEENKYKLTRTNTEFKDEIKTMMIAPMNAWDGQSIDMIGLLYITSGKRNIFKMKDVDALAFVSDTLATSVSNIINIIGLISNNEGGI